MDVEKTIEFILGQQARTEAALGRLAERQDKTDALLSRAIRAAIHEARAERGRRQEMAEDWNSKMAEWKLQMSELKEAQRQTEATLKAFIESMRRGGNGTPQH